MLLAVSHSEKFFDAPNSESSVPQPIHSSFSLLVRVPALPASLA